MLGLSKQKAMEEHRKMWNWIADQYRNGRNDSVVNLKQEYISCYTCYSAVNNLCFCCEYAKQRCKESGDIYNMCNYCPVEWKSDVPIFQCIDKIIDDDQCGLYGKMLYYSESSIPTEKRLLAEIAEEIANLPESEE